MAETKATMRALRFHRHGGPEVMQFDEVTVPTPGPGEVLIKVAGAGINPVDWKIRNGYAKFPAELPAIMAREFSGTVVGLGPGVTDFEQGDEVYGIAPKGTCAEYTVANVAEMGLKPPSMDLPDSASIPLAGMTAWQALFVQGDVQPGQRVLIHAAAGGVGSFAVQLAKWKGAYVYGTASKEIHSLLRDIGVDEPIDYRDTPFEAVVQDVDFVLETVGGEQMARSLSVLKPGGTLVSVVGGVPEEEAQAQGKQAKGFMMRANREELDRLAALVQDLKVRPVIDAVVPFEEAIEAFKESEGGHVHGKLVVHLS